MGLFDTPLAELVESQVRRLFAIPCYQREAIRRRSGRLGEQVVLVSRSIGKFEDRLGSWLGQEERSDESLIADADGVHIAERRLVQHRWSSQKVQDLIGTLWE